MASCRACFTNTKNMIPIDDLFVKNYNFLTNLNISLNDGFSQVSCTNCWEIVKCFMEFRIKCITTETMMKNVISNAFEIDIKPDINMPKENCDDLKAENECKETLHSLGCESDTTSANMNNNSIVNKKENISQPTNIHYMELLKMSCGICKLSYLDRNRLNEHIESHRNDKACQICNETFRDWPEILSHRLVHTFMNRGRCHLCPKYYKSQLSLEYHYRNFHNDGNSLKLKCKQCARSYETPVKLKKHVQNVHSNRVFVCDYCSKTFNSKQKLKVHILGVIGYKKYTCDICEYSSKYNSGLKEHKIRKHSLIKVYCKICARVFKNQQKHDEHICVCEKKLCPVCGKQINTSTRMTRHLETHKNDKRYKCDRCSTSYKCKTALQVHRDRHDGNRTKHCEFCPAKFYSATVLLKHRRIHTGERPYVCKICQKSFTGNSNLKVHMKVHGEYLINKVIKRDGVQDI